MTILKVNGEYLPDPSEFAVDLMDIDGQTTRNAKGDLMRDWIATKRKLKCAWPALDMTPMSTILKAVRGTSFDIYYPDPFEGKWITKKFYVGDRHMPVYSIINGVVKWEGLSMNFIEY